MKRGLIVAGLALALAACGHVGANPALTPNPVIPEAAAATTPAERDSVWHDAQQHFRHGQWSKAITLFERALLELPPGDSRVVLAHFFLGEAKLADGQQLEAAREFRRVSDQTPNDTLAPIALLRVGDAYSQLWRRPELDPTYGQTAMGTYQELLNRYPGTPAATRAQARIAALQDDFAYKQYRAALYYMRNKAYNSAVLYLKDLVATYPRADVAPDALLQLVEAYQELGYQEDVQETCGYLQRFHPNTPGLAKACPALAGGVS